MPEALYRKYRPQVFADVVGQEPIERTLKNAIVQNKVSHAYLFTGPRGTGKTTTARLLAKALLCQTGPTPEPDGTCEDCELIAEGVHPDVYELDAASRTGVENVREEIISRVGYAPTRGRSKVYIIDEVHMLSAAAFNALLKTLEEPPEHVVFILCTTDPQKVPETIHSRCQRFDFHRIAPESIVTRLGAICVEEDVAFEGEALDLIAQRAEGGLRNALTALEQVIAFENGKVTLEGAERMLGAIDTSDLSEIMALVGRRDVAGCFRWISDYVETGADLAQFVRDMAEHVRNLYILALAGDEAALEIGETTRRTLSNELQWFGEDRASRMLAVLGDLSAELKTSSNPRLSFEIALTRMVRPDSDLTLEALAERVEALESGYSAVSHVISAPAFADAGDRNAAIAEPQRAVPVNAAQGPASSAGAFAAAGAAGSEASDPAFGRTAAGAPADARVPDAGQAVQAEGAGRRGGEASAPAGEPIPHAEPQQQAAQQEQPAPARQTHQAGKPAAAAVPSDAPTENADRGKTGAAANAGGSGPALHDAADAAVAAGGPALANPATMQRVWQAAMSALKKAKQAYGALFLNTKASYDDGRCAVRVVFPEGSTFAFKAAQKEDVQNELANALQKAFGGAIDYYLVQGNAPGASQQPSAQPAAAEASVQQDAPDDERQHGQPAPEDATPDFIESQPEERPQAVSAEPQAAGQDEAAGQDDDSVPVDLYEDEVPLSAYDDISAPAYEPEPEMTANNPVGTAADGPARAEDDQAQSEIQAMLQSGFGLDLILEEVDE